MSGTFHTHSFHAVDVIAMKNINHNIKQNYFWTHIYRNWFRPRPLLFCCAPN